MCVSLLKSSLIKGAVTKYLKGLCSFSIFVLLKFRLGITT